MKIILGRREIMAGVQLPEPNVYAFSELGAKKMVSGEQRRQDWATAEGVFRVVSPVAEGQNREGFAGGREVFWRPPEELVGLQQCGGRRQGSVAHEGAALESDRPGLSPVLLVHLGESVDLYLPFFICGTVITIIPAWGWW